jgi:sterol 22-desaturase
MVIPSVWPSCYDAEVFPEPEKFDPERWIDEKSIANENPNKYLVFGSGPHRCIGIDYTKMYAAGCHGKNSRFGAETSSDYRNMSVVMGNAAVLMNWTHHPTADSETPILLPT